MKIPGILPFTHSLLQQVIQPNDTVLDATMGKGLDTLFLAQQVGEKGRVLAYDIQADALRITKQRLEQENCLSQVTLLQKGHETAEEELSHLSQPIAAATFNLGYLPGGHEHIITHASTTIQALRLICRYLKPLGLITVVVYPGHEGGQEEASALLEEVRAWDSQSFHVFHYQLLNNPNDPPFLIAIQKRA